MTFALPPLPYYYTALAPHIDEATMRIHHDKHHAAYVNNLNAALEGQDALKGKTIEAILSDLEMVPENIRMVVRNNGGGHYNHTIFWEMMTPGGAKEPCLALMDRVRERREEYVITKHGKAVAKLVPVGDEDMMPQGAFGWINVTVIEYGDIVSPIAEDDWEVLQDDQGEPPNHD